MQAVIIFTRHVAVQLTALPKPLQAGHLTTSIRQPRHATTGATPGRARQVSTRGSLGTADGGDWREGRYIIPAWPTATRGM